MKFESGTFLPDDLLKREIVVRPLLLFIYAARSFDSEHTKLSDEVDKSLDAARALYGGREGYDLYRQEAAAYFKAGRKELAEPVKPRRPFRNMHPARSDKLKSFLDDDDKKD